MFNKLMHAIVLVTPYCNLDCSFCSAKWLKGGTDYLENYEYYKLFDNLCEMNVGSIALAGGEPLLSTDILNYIEYIKKKNIIVTMSTNGMLITEQIVSQLKEKGLDRLQFSLDGPETIHDTMRGNNGLYKNILNGIELCKKYDLKSNIMMTVNEDNLEYIDEMIHLAKHLGVSIYIERMIGEKTSDFYKKYIEELLRISTNKEYESIVFTNDPYINMLMIGNLVDDIVYGGCTAGILSCTITSTGDVLACPNLPVVAGNIKNTTLRDIWDNSNLFKILRNKEFVKNTKCSDCNKNRLCSGCRADAFCDSGHIMGVDPICLLKL